MSSADCCPDGCLKCICPCKVCEDDQVFERMLEAEGERMLHAGELDP